MALGEKMEKYKVKDYMKHLKEHHLLQNVYEIDNLLDETVEHFSYNSQDVQDHTMFLCKGAHFKEEYLRQSIQKGVFIYISEKKYEVDLPCIIVNNIRDSLALLSRMYFGKPDENLTIVGITGTKGKTTMLYYLKSILNEYERDRKQREVGYLSTIETYDGKRRYESLLSTPESYDLYQNLRNAVDSKIQTVVMEASSQALKYNRLGELTFAMSVFLNIGEDHISDVEHPNFEDYFHSKLQIFQKSRATCINLDDSYSQKMLEKARGAIGKENQIMTFSMEDEKADVYGYHLHKEGLSTLFHVRTNQFDCEFELTMPGIFNVSNALAAIGVATYYQIPEKYMIRGLKMARVPGRMEVYKSQDEKILGIVDYAHNQLSFQKVYETVKKEYPERKIITVFGCPGSKAYTRRKDLGNLSGKYSDQVILTADDPGYEQIKDICNEIAQYIQPYHKNYYIVEDRAEAIKQAVEFILNQQDRYILLILRKRK